MDNGPPVKVPKSAGIWVKSKGRWVASHLVVFQWRCYINTFSFTLVVSCFLCCLSVVLRDSVTKLSCHLCVCYCMYVCIYVCTLTYVHAHYTYIWKVHGDGVYICRYDRSSYAPLRAEVSKVFWWGVDIYFPARGGSGAPKRPKVQIWTVADWVCSPKVFAEINLSIETKWNEVLQIILILIFIISQENHRIKFIRHCRVCRPRVYWSEKHVCTCLFMYPYIYVCVCMYACVSDHLL